MSELHPCRFCGADGEKLELIDSYSEEFEGETAYCHSCHAQAPTEIWNSVESSASPVSYAFRFRSLGGAIYSNNQDAFEPKISTTRARQLLNAFYNELSKHDQHAADHICKLLNA